MNAIPGAGICLLQRSSGSRSFDQGPALSTSQLLDQPAPDAIEKIA